MGKFYTFINNGIRNTKVPTSQLDQYLEAGWRVGNYNQEELNRKSGAAVKRKNQQMRDAGEWEEWNARRNHKVTNGLKKFWSTVEEDYIQQHEEKKEMSRQAWTEEERKYYLDKMTASAIANRQTITPEEYAARSKKATQTRKKNGTFAVSSFEDRCYEALIASYGIEDIIRSYHTDVRYPFNCDFYLKSKDLFIELNIHPSHYSHPFNVESSEDIELLGMLRNSNDKWDLMIADVWGNRDIKKKEMAEKNQLNYLAIYRKEFESFIIAIGEKKL